MPVIFSFDLEGAAPVEHNRLQSMFERFGWERLGGSSYRYPELGSDEPTEDWLNNVVPALMLFRAYAVKAKKVVRYSLDVQTSTGYNPARGYGAAPADSTSLAWSSASNQQFGKKKLTDWIDKIEFPY